MGQKPIGKRTEYETVGKFVGVVLGLHRLRGASGVGAND
jgi:hypothetical protein